MATRMTGPRRPQVGVTERAGRLRTAMPHSKSDSRAGTRAAAPTARDGIRVAGLDSDAPALSTADDPGRVTRPTRENRAGPSIAATPAPTLWAAAAASSGPCAADPAFADRAAAAWFPWEWVGVGWWALGAPYFLPRDAARPSGSPPPFVPPLWKGVSAG
jgi:hypothetical protein